MGCTRWTVAIAMITSLVPAAASGGDHDDRELPTYAVQPPGASFERTVSTKQYLVMIRETLGATCDAVFHAPIRSLESGSARVVERAGVQAAGCPLHGPGCMARACPEAGGPPTPARLTSLFDSRPAYDALMALIASARCRIDLMIFGWDDDAAGRPVAAALIERAGRACSSA